MVTQILNAEPDASGAVRIQNVSAVRDLIQSLPVGEVARIIVRNNPLSGEGQILFRGELISAKLPPNVQPGDLLLTKLLQASNEALLFKILDVQTPSKLQGSQLKLLTELTSQLKLLTAKGLTLGEGAPQPINLPESPLLSGPVLEKIEQLISSFSTLEELQNPELTFKTLNSSIEGTLTKTIKDLTTQLKAYLDTNLPTPEMRIMLAVRESLMRVLDAVKDNIDAKNDLFRLINFLTKEDQNEKTVKDPRTKELLQSILKELKTLTSTQLGKTGQLTATLEKLLAKTAEFAPSPHGADIKSLTELSTLVTKLNQTVQLQETLNQLNPIMQALGEPALILFPFLFQGLLSQGEVTIDSRPEDGEGDDESEVGEEEKKKKSKPFNRIQVSVPLPAIGTVDVDIMHREKEIMAKVFVPNNEIRLFISKKLNELSETLSAHGFEAVELAAALSDNRQTTPEWALELTGKRDLLV